MAAAKSKITSFFKPVNQLQQPTNDAKENQAGAANLRPPTKRRRTVKSGDDSEGDRSVDTPDKGDVGSVEIAGAGDEEEVRAGLVQLAQRLPLLQASLGLSWFSALRDQFTADWFARLSSFVTGERAGGTVVYPGPEQVWQWTRHTDIRDTRVVILGQDPYHGPGQAHGLAFSVPPGVPPPPSLVNIYKELAADIPGFVAPGHGWLAGWADQGVLLLNSCLTVQKAKPNSHKDRGWEKVTDAVISWISRNLTGVVFLLWGSHAQKKAGRVDGSRHHLLKSVHPSPLSAYRGFLGCKHFSQCNQLLVSQGKQAIDWARLPDK